MKNRIPQLAVAAVTSVFGMAALGAGLKIELPLETVSFKPGEHSEIANAQCLICHSAEYVTTQPPMPRAFWKANVEKMQQKYGAPIPMEQTEALVDYLAKHYGSSSTNNPATAETQKKDLSRRAESGTGLLMDGGKIAVKYGCIGCHQEKVKLVGPALQQIAAKYKDDSSAREKVAAQITQSGSGKWGSILMPPFPKIPEAEIKVLTDWVLNQK